MGMTLGEVGCTEEIIWLAGLATVTSGLNRHKFTWCIFWFRKIFALITSRLDCAYTTMRLAIPFCMWTTRLD